MDSWWKVVLSPYTLPRAEPFSFPNLLLSTTMVSLWKSPDALRPLTLCNCDCKTITTAICFGVHRYSVRCIHATQRYVFVSIHRHFVKSLFAKQLHKEGMPHIFCFSCSVTSLHVCLNSSSFFFHSSSNISRLSNRKFHVIHLCVQGHPFFSFTLFLLFRPLVVLLLLCSKKPTHS